MQLARDLLDNQVLDKFNRRMGKVDDVVLVMRRGKPPRVAAIELGLSTTLGRIHEGLAGWAVRLERRFGVSDGTPIRVDIDRVDKAGINVVVAIDAERTQVYAWERWIRRVLIGKIPGHGSGGPEAEKK
jgi:sporulation protein YlmC with PRC-barrel domain